MLVPETILSQSSPLVFAKVHGSIDISVLSFVNKINTRLRWSRECSADKVFVLKCNRSSFTTFGGHGRPPNIPPITAEQAGVLSGIHFLAQEHAFALSMQKRDMRFVKEFGIMHAQTAYMGDSQYRYVILPSSLTSKG